MNCSDLNIPDRLHTNGKPIVNDFDPDELLYRRFPIKGNDGNPLYNPVTKKLTHDAFPLRCDSVNRGRYSKPEDVLYDIKEGNHYLNWGICSFTVEQAESISCTVKVKDNDDIYTIQIKHRPEECMYPHSEITIFKNGEKVPKISPSSAKLYIRDKFLEALKVYREPQ